MKKNTSRRSERGAHAAHPQARAAARAATRSRMAPLRLPAAGRARCSGSRCSSSGVIVFRLERHRHPAHADDAALVLKGNDIVNPINTVWTLVAAFLVFCMQAGFTMLEAGFCRSRETVNVLLECIVDTCLCGLLFYAWGFAFMFGAGTPFIGTEFFFLQGAPGDLRLDRRRVPGLLALPVRLRRHLLDDHLGRHDRPHRLRRRPDLQRRRLGLHLPDHRPLGLGSGRLARDDGQRRQLPRRRSA